jgi:aldose 1-epimerase
MPANPHELLAENRFQKDINNKQTGLYFLEGENGFTVAITNYGARIVSIFVPGKDGNLTDVVLGFDSIDQYLTTDEIYHGAIVGRYANRIAKGKFSIGSNEYQLAVNNGPNHLHGGLKGFDSKVWDVLKSEQSRLVLQYVSPDGEEGYPGTLTTTVSYTVKDTELEIEFQSSTDKETVINLTNHAYFNLNGQGTGSIHDHELMINANAITPVDETLIPTGELRTVLDTPFDFKNAHKIGERIDADDAQLKFGGGYDHNFVLDRLDDSEIVLAARAKGDQSGIVIEVWTTEPGIQLYTGNFMSGKNTLKYGKKDTLRSAFCLETQHFPDSPNHPSFPSTFLKPHKVFHSKTIFRFE